MISARLTIDLGALVHNFGVLKAASTGAEIAPVLKADGYGLGADTIGRHLAGEGARSFFVARLSEGEALRDALSDYAVQIFVLDGCTPETAPRLKQAGLTPVLNSLAEINHWIEAGKGAAALHVDTGMNRLGVAADEVAQAAKVFAQTPDLDLVLVMSHLAAAADHGDARNAAQLARFDAACSAFPGVPASLSASAGIFLGPTYRFDMVRPGISLFGGGPQERPDRRFKAVATLEAPVLQTRRVKAGETIGYGAMFTATRDMEIAVLGAGYADGVLRCSFGKGKAYVKGQLAPLAVVTMDMICVDISGVSGVKAGDPVELLGPHVLLDDAAAAAGTAAHECLTRLNARAERVFV